MKYISTIQALNLHYEDQITPGDWHAPSTDFINIDWFDTNNSPFDDFDIKLRKYPTIEQDIPVAGHVRACLDAIVDGKYALISDMKEHFIGNDELNSLFLRKLLLIKNTTQFNECFNKILKTYRLDWINVLEEAGIDWQHIINLKNSDT